ncbi:MAG TPA: NAD(P)H-dependent oxidoreductase [Polyangiaceae bacterium]|nr:NAD(P)H-dependent oxidoreductase [Polyangiaceae bacterium]
MASPPSLPAVLCLCGSLRQQSSNLSLLRAMIELAPPGLAARIARPLDRLPHFNPDIDVEPGPDAVREFREEVASAPALIISSPEYAFGVPGVLKNALDWLVSSGELYDKPTALITASPNYGGAARAQAHLLDTLRAQQARLVEAACVSVAAVRTRFDAAGRLVDADTVRALRDGWAALEGAARAEPPG